MTGNGTFLAAFFGHGNRSMRERHQSWIQMLDQGRPVVLPRAMSAQDMEAYCFAPTAEGLEQVTSIVRASLGSTWAGGGSREGWGGQSAFDQRLEALAGTVYEGGRLHVRRLRIAPAHARPVAVALERLGALLRGAPYRATRSQEGLSQLLRRVRAGAAAGHHGRNDVEAAIKALLDQGLLAPINIDFLRTWAMAEMGLFGDVLDNDSCKRAQQFSQRPKLVTAAISKAAWHVDLESLFESRDFHELLRVYREHTERRYGRVLEAYRAQDGWLADLYRAVYGLAMRDSRYCSQALVALDRGARPPRDFIAYARAECASGDVLSPDAPSQPRPKELIEAGRFDAAVEALRHQGPSVERVKLLWACALQVDSALEVLQVWLNRFDDAERKVYHEAVPALARLREASVTPQTAPPAASSVPDSPPAATWLEWLDRANHGGTERDLRDAEPSRAGLGARPLISVEGGIDEGTTKFCDYLRATRPQRMEDRVLASLPEMVGAWHGWDAPPKAKAKAADAIICYVAVTEIVNQWPSSPALAYGDLVSERLALGMDVAAYRDAVESLKPLVGREASRASVECAIEFAELLAENPCPDAVGRKEFLGLVAGKVVSMAQKLDCAARAAFKSICLSLGLPELVLPEKARGLADGDGSHLKGAADATSKPRLRIGAYTLEVGVGQRFKEIAEVVHGVQVVLNHDHVETDALRELGHTDAVIVVTRCAKHAATDAIRRHVGKDHILYADGRGSSSMLRVLRTYCERVGY